MDDRGAAPGAGGFVVADDLVEGVLAVDRMNTIAFASAGAHRILDRRPGTLVGGSAMEAFLDHRVEDLVSAARRQGSAAGDLPPRISDGRWLVARARRGPDQLTWIVLEDVTELRRLQRIRAEFLDNLSHELRTPVTNVNLLLEMLVRDAGGFPPRARERLERLQVEAAQLAQMVSELLDLASIEGGQPLTLADLDLADVAREQVERLRIFAERSGVVLSIEVPGTAPVVRGDPTRLGQVVLNLVHNAVKFSEPGDVVVVRVTAAEETATVAVIDQGAGIPWADRDRIFERFYKVDRARQRGTGGTGLGLAIVRHVAQAHGGRPGRVRGGDRLHLHDRPPAHTGPGPAMPGSSSFGARLWRPGRRDRGAGEWRRDAWRSGPG